MHANHADRAREIEAGVRARLDANDVDGAATVALRGHGAEIFSFLLALHQREHDAEEAFSIFSEHLWRGLPRFAWQCPLRAWAYVVARNASHRQRAHQRRHGSRRADLSSSLVSEVVAEVRTETLSLFRTAKRTAIQALREELPVDDQMLLVLRVDRGLAWNELARVFHEEEGALTDADLKRASARLRKRFQSVKERLFAMARERGILEGSTAR